MNTPPLNNREDIKNKFDELLKFQNEKEELEHEATTLSLQFISTFNKLMGTSVTKKNIADAIGTSRSYVTQLFNGSKLLNLETIIKIQKVLNAKVKISLTVDNIETPFRAKPDKEFCGIQVPSLRKNEKRIIGIPLKKTNQKAGKDIAIKSTEKRKTRQKSA